MKKELNIFSYNNFRKFLRDFYNREKKKAPGRFSYRFFSRLAGFASTNNLLLVMKGERNLTYDSIQKFSLAMKLNKREKGYFEALVFYNQSKDPQEKVKHFRKLMSFREFREARLLSKEHMEYFSKWYYPAIREMVNVADFRDDPEWIANQLRPRITGSEAKEAFEILQKLNLVRKNESGKWVQVDQHVSMGDGMGSMDLVMFHREMIRLGSESLRDPSHEREISSVTMSVSEEIFKRIKEKIGQFEKEIQQLISNNGTEEKIDRVCQLNFQLFRLSETEEKTERSESYEKNNS